MKPSEILRGLADALDAKGKMITSAYVRTTWYLN